MIVKCQNPHPYNIKLKKFINNKLYKFLKYYYNKKNKTDLSYNQILDKYIINKIKLKSFSISKQKYNAVFPVAHDDLTKYVNGSHATSYWLSTSDLCKFGI